MYKLNLTVCLFLLTACAAPKYNYTGSAENLSWPSVGETNTVGIGENMLNQGYSLQMDALSFDSLQKIGGAAYKIPPGDYVKTGEDNNAEYYLVNNTNGGRVIVGILADPVISVMKSKNNKDNEICLITVLNLKNCSKNIPTTIKKVNSVNANGFQQNLLYSGKVGNRIKLSYREFQNNMARQAFSNDVEYDLSESDQVGYKGALLEIINATNQSITYKVIRNFNTPNK
ncbi:MAG: hypothetical protein D8H97_01920 [Neisseria sp.]|jgi:hypothetical protein|nr:MAG: hypothetical protein D8H97_01920 [Neisseria sp.]